ncbi:alpha/beta hydrolase [Pseudomonas putida]|uniref:Alpha/beta hydrolase n=1 Tax=Pseudomonas putida TaxID=303 RepID=A0AAW5HHC7_PSEPU|nr:alpha/beta hydrolase [Pseudomonas putida]MCO1621805.1 alpha/beta hydrolase [Pseudomonas putida]
MSLNPDLAAYLQLVEAGRSAGKVLPMHALAADEARRQFEESSALIAGKADEPDCISDLSLTTRDGHTLPVRLYRPPQADPALAGAALLYLHGGGYVVGSLDSHDTLCWNLAQDAGVPVIAVGYRLAPQWRFPTASDDALDAWRWLVEQADALGIDAQRLAVVGDSVGGSLATILANQLAAQRELPAPRLQVMIYPVTDASCRRPSVQRYGSGYLLEAQTLEWFYRQYATVPADRHDPRFSPLLGSVASNSAPALMLIAECDPLHDQGVAYARHLEQAGVAVQLAVIPGVTHDFMRMGSIIEEADEGLAMVVEALQQHL